jgi:hypothetical protein
VERFSLPRSLTRTRSGPAASPCFTGAVGLRPVDGVQHHHGDLPLGLLFVVRIRRPEFQGLLPERGAFFAGGGSRLRLQLFGSDLDLHTSTVSFRAVPPGPSVPGGTARKDTMRIA